MEILIKLKEQGWHLTEEGLKKIQDAEIPGAADVKKIISAALNWDFREIAGGALPTKREDTLPGRIVLQVQKIRNISAPKANEESKSAPRLLQVDLSDGQTLLQGLELEPIPSLNLNVAPGTKVYLRAERLQLMQGFAVLRAADVQVLGGRVEQLAEKWELARTMLKYARCGRRISGSSGPPPWIAFGKKLDVKEPLDTRNFKSLQAAMEKEKEGSKENEEFNAMRTEAIAEAAKAGARKVFGGGHQQILDHNVKKILERGYSEEDAQHALRTTNNNLERALYNLKRRDESKRSDNNVRNNTDSALPNGRSDRGSSSAREFNGKRGAANAKEVAAAVKPATNTLFDFLTEKLPANSEGAGKSEQAAARHPPTESNSNSNIKIEKSKSDVAKTSKQLQDSSAAATAAAAAEERRPRFENNMSSSFSANRSTGEGRRQDRESQRNSEKQSNTRYSGTSGGRSGNGRGGRRGQQKYEKTAEGDGGGRGAYQQQRRDDGGNAIRGERNSNRGRRGSHERTNAAATAQNGNGKSQQQQNAPGVASETRRDQQTKRNEKSRHNAKERSNNYEGSNNRRRDNNSNRQQNSYATAENNNNNNKESSAAAPNSNNNPSSNTDSSVCINKLVESTSKLKIDKSRDSGRGNQQRQRQATQQQQQQPQRQQRNHQQYSSEQKMSTSSPAPVMVQQYQPPQLHPHQQQMLMNQQPQTQANYGQQLVNGFTYDPSKIIGFQNKETNEFAMTLLKSQGIAAAMSPPLAASPAAHFMPPQSSDGSSMTAAASTQQPPSPFGKPAAFVLPTVQPPPPPLPLPPQNASDYGVPSTPACEKWSWKVGDLCFAKYWDDGRYYEAEVTGVSDKTCVVFFHGYGNHEEVLKGDCLPITDVNHLPINHFNASQQQEQPQQPAAFQQGQQNFATSASSRAVSNRYRGERQVYVPPPKRDNCN